MFRFGRKSQEEREVHGLENIYIVAGLGNPGREYENTRHNVGFEVADLLASKYGIRIGKLKHKALLGDGDIGGKRVLLAKPQTYMNLSGESIREMVEWYKIPMSHVIIIYDDIDLPVGKIRIRPQGSAGTHNGMRSMLYQLQTDVFPRIRVGIGKPLAGWQLADYVLGRFTPEERKLMDTSVQSAADAVVTLLQSDMNTAMNRYNK